MTYLYVMLSLYIKIMHNPKFTLFIEHYTCVVCMQTGYTFWDYRITKLKSIHIHIMNIHYIYSQHSSLCW